MDRAVCLVCRVRPVVVVRWVLNERSHRCIEWMLPWLSRNSSRFMNENQVFALHFIQISASGLLQSSHEISVFTFYVFNHSSLAAHGALVTTLLQGGHLLILRWILQNPSTLRPHFSPQSILPHTSGLIQSLINRSHFNLADPSRPPQAIPLDMMSFDDDPLSPPKSRQSE